MEENLIQEWKKRRTSGNRPVSGPHRPPRTAYRTAAKRAASTPLRYEHRGRSEMESMEQLIINSSVKS